MSGVFACVHLCVWCAHMRVHSCVRHEQACHSLPGSEGENGVRSKGEQGRVGERSKGSETDYHAIDNVILCKCEEQMMVRPDTVGVWVTWGAEADGNSILLSLLLPQS